MAIEPYKPPQDHKHRDDLDREIDAKLDRAFHRWNWKVARFIRRGVIVLFVLWLAWNIIPAALEFLLTQPLGPLILQFLAVGSYLFFFIGFQFFLMYYFMARTRIYWVLPGETGVSFKDYRGNPEVLEAATRIVTLIKGAKEFKDMGGELTRGVLLIGPPGTGKSYLAQAVSTEAGVPFGYLSAPSLTSAWMGMGNIKVMNLYRKARKLAREYGACILFIDEIDAVGMARSTNLMGQGALGMDDTAQTTGVRKMVMGMGMGGGSGILNELLLQMDPPPQESSLKGKLLRWLGFRRNKKPEMPPVLTMGATNLAETLDAALLRPGRFDRKIYVGPPDADGRKEILEYYLAKVKHEPMPMERLISDTIGYTPVAIKYVINEAVIHAHFDSRQAINYWDFTRAREVHEWGLRSPIRNMSYEERRRIAYHEAGHAYVQFKLISKERIAKVTIIRHGGALGFMAPKPVEEQHTWTKEELLADIQVTLAARAVEEELLNLQLNGVTSDMAQATARVAYMVGAYAMDNTFFSFLALGGPQAAASPDVKERIERILQEQYALVRRLIAQNREAVIAIAEALILRNELTDIDIKDILSRVEADQPYQPLRKEEARLPLGFKSTKALPAPRPSRRNGSAKLADKAPVIIDQQARREARPSAPEAGSEPPSQRTESFEDGSGI
jgi:ATP-dependent Zn protease